MINVYETADQYDELACMAGYPDARYGEIIIERDYVVEFKEKERPKFLINEVFVIRRELFDDPAFKAGKSFEEMFYQGSQRSLAHKSDAWFFRWIRKSITRISPNRYKQETIYESPDRRRDGLFGARRSHKINELLTNLKLIAWIDFGSSKQSLRKQNILTKIF